MCENDYCEEDRPGYEDLKKKIDLQWKERELKQKTLERAKWPHGEDRGSPERPALL